MKIIIIVFVFFLNIANVFSETSESNEEVLRKVWSLGQKRACTHKMQQSFNEENFQILSQHAIGNDRERLASVLNPFLFSLGMSHTKFFTDKDEDYFFFKSFHASNDSSLPEPPKIVNPGVQIAKDAWGYYIREVLDGFPAQKASLFRGDRIITVGGKKFEGVWGSSASRVTVEILRDGKFLRKQLELLSLNWSDAFLEATKNSAKVIQVEQQKIGYVRLWTGTHPKSAEVLRNTVATFHNKVDSIILDLRGGYGGAWWDHLRPFYSDTSTFFSAKVWGPDGEIDIWEAPLENNPNAFKGRMVVLINEGVRSGKEALAYQFKKTARAHLVGTKTPGYFSVGGFFFTGLPVDYALYLCVKQVTLDDNEIEGVGVKPDQEVKYSYQSNYGDTQIESAVKYLAQ